MMSIQELDPFGYTPLSISLRFSHLSPCVWVKYLVFSKKRKKKKRRKDSNLFWCKQNLLVELSLIVTHYF